MFTVSTFLIISGFALYFAGWPTIRRLWATDEETLPDKMGFIGLVALSIGGDGVVVNLWETLNLPGPTIFLVGVLAIFATLKKASPTTDGGPGILLTSSRVAVLLFGIIAVAVSALWTVSWLLANQPRF